MQPMSPELIRLLADRLKAGMTSKPVQRVEVDRMVFIPGRTEELEFTTLESEVEKEVVQTWIEGDGESTYGTIVPSFPVAGRSLAHMTSPYGMRWGTLHAGIDIGAPVGLNVLAAWDGKVTRVVRELYNGYGTYIDIQHKDKVLTRYAHLSETLVKVGDEVKRGQVIAKSGNTGNVWAGHFITGSYNDPNSERSRGLGAHLHFEIHAPNSKGELVKVDPVPYLNGTTQMFTASTNYGTGVSSGDVARGVPGEVRLNETFTTRAWYQNQRYLTDPQFVSKHTLGNAMHIGLPTRAALLTFDPATTKVNTTVTLAITVTMKEAGFMNFGFFTTFSNGDELRITENGKLVRSVNKFTGKLQGLNEIYLPKGDNRINISIHWKAAGKKTKQVFGITQLFIQELTYPSPSSKDPSRLDPISDTGGLRTGGRWETQTIEHFVFNEKVDRVELQVGRFVYMDTLILDNVRSIEIDDQYEMEAREATLILSNPDGYYSPDYNPYLFPETYRPTPWSYYANGLHIGVLSENTPVRIYLGYGQNLMRVFTGLIDKVDIVAQHTMTVQCRDMYKRLQNKVLTENREYPKIVNPEQDKVAWVKSAVIQDLVAYAGMFGWRACEDDLHYPDAVIEETYLIEVNQKEGYVIKAVPDREGEFITEPIASFPTPQGWMNPFVSEYGKTFEAYKYKVSDCINEELQDTNYRSYCDRYGTYRLEQIKLNKPVVAEFSEDHDLITLSKTLDFSRGRSHVVIWDSEGKQENFIDKEILVELKGEVRTAVVSVPWAKSPEAKRAVADRLFFDMKRLSRTLQVSVVGNPALDVLDRVRVVNKSSTTRGTYIIKGVRTTFSDSGFIQVIDLMWSVEGAVV